MRSGIVLWASSYERCDRKWMKMCQVAMIRMDLAYFHAEHGAFHGFRMLKPSVRQGFGP